MNILENCVNFLVVEYSVMPTTTYAETYDDVGLMGGEDVQVGFLTLFSKFPAFRKTLIG